MRFAACLKLCSTGAINGAHQHTGLICCEKPFRTTQGRRHDREKGFSIQVDLDRLV